MTQSELQVKRVAEQLDAAVTRLNEVQITLSGLAARYEYVGINMEKEQIHVQRTVKEIYKDLDKIHERLAKVEQTLWKFSGALLVVIFVSQILIKYFNL